MTLTGKPIPPLKPGSPEWLKTISASKIPAILGISPWQSKFALWHLMAGNTEPWDGNKATERGTFLEAAVLDWFKAQHTDSFITGSATIAHPDSDDWVANPDAIIYAEKAGVEIKTSQYADGWGQQGTAEVPPYYLAQVAWQMVVCGFRRVYVPVLFGQPFEFREYVVNYEDVETDVPFIIAAVEEFQASLAAGQQPDIDGSTATYQTIKELQPDIDGEKIDIPEAMGAGFLKAKETADQASAVADEYKNLIAEYMGTAKTARLWDQPLFNRQAKSGGTPYLVIARTLPKPKETELAA